MMGKMLVRVVAPHFVAGLIIEQAVCVAAAPILAWAIGRSAPDLSRYFRSQRWQASILPPIELHDGR